MAIKIHVRDTEKIFAKTQPTLRRITFGCRVSLMLSGCAETERSANITNDKQSESTADAKPLVERVLTQEEQDNLTPDQVFKLLQDGNRRFVDGTLTSRDHSRQVRDAALGLAESKVTVEDLIAALFGSAVVLIVVWGVRTKKKVSFWIVTVVVIAIIIFLLTMLDC